MSANFYELMRYAKTGVASPDMTAYDKMRAIAMAGGAKYPVTTITGVPPIRFKSDGSPLISWSMLGNGRQTGTPSPDNPIMPDFVGERTANVMPFGQAMTVEESGVTFTADGAGRYYVKGTATNLAIVLFSIPEFTIPKSVGDSGSGTMSLFNNFTGSTCTLGFYYNGTAIDTWSLNSQNRTNSTYVGQGLQKCNQVRVQIGAGITVDGVVAPMFTDDSTFPSSFEPYGSALTLTSASQSFPVYLGQVQTVRRVKKLVLTGTEDLLMNADGWFYLTSVPADYLRSAGNVTSMCSHYPTYKQSSSIAQLPEGYTAFSWETEQRLYLKDTAYRNDLSSFTQWVSAQYAAGTPVTVWYVTATPETAIVNEPLAKIGDYADELHSTDAGVTVTTVRGSNVLTVDTDLQPSSVSITGHIKQM